MQDLRKKPFICLCIWSVFICLLSAIVYKAVTKEKSPVLPPTAVKQEAEPFRGNNMNTYIELIRMPAETVFEKIRVMITNKKNNSIFYDMDEYSKVTEQLNGAGYRGKLIYQKAVGKENCFVVINEVPLEEYLYGVVPSEMPSGYPAEALKAQAICARTYAVIQMMNPGYPDYNAHVNDTTSYQVYHNIDEQESTNRAVDETAGMLLFQDNGEELAETYYYSTSCGEIHGATDNAAFLACISSTNTSDFEVNESWYRWNCRVSDIDHTNMLLRLQVRQKAGAANVLTMTKDNTFENQKISELKKIKELFISKRGEDGVGQELIISTEKHTYKVVGEYNIRYVLNDGGTNITKQNGDSVTMATLLPSAFISLEAIKKDGQVTGYDIIGGGYGHGIGMSQNGAKEMAKQGYTTEEILAYYYPGSHISDKL